MPAAANGPIRSLGLALAGAAAGFTAAFLVVLLFGFEPLFLAFPLLVVLPALATALAVPIVALAAGLLHGRLSAAAVATVAGVLTFALFAALPLYFFLRGSARTGGLLFG